MRNDQANGKTKPQSKRTRGSFPPASAAGAPQPEVSVAQGIFAGVPSPPSTMGTAQLADFLGLSDRTVRDLAARGVLPRIGEGRFETRGAMRANAPPLRDQVAGPGKWDTARWVLRPPNGRAGSERAVKIAIKCQSNRSCRPLSR